MVFDGKLRVTNTKNREIVREPILDPSAILPIFTTNDWL